MTDDPPSQTHSDTSVESARALKRERIFNQERIVYETLRQDGLSDWQLWRIIRSHLLLRDKFDQISSMRRARIGLLWRSRKLGATPWHPVEDSGRRNVDPQSNKRTVIWKLKKEYIKMTYVDWRRDYRNLARAINEPDDLV